MMPRWLSLLLDAVLPPKGDVLVAKQLTEEVLGALCNPRVAYEHWVVSLFPYRDARIRALIKSVKFYGEKAPLQATGRLLGEYVLEVVSDKKLFSGWNTPLLVPIPASAKRLKERGYNQVERFSESALPYLNDSVIYEPKTLIREDRKSQVRIPREARGENIQNAFFVPNASAVSGQYVILLDDVVESGATMEDARRALRAAGAKDVIGIAIAR